ncbi:hypothetical protein K8I61_01670 [bacterium]|nr:hypothetical protein [bacterium]
MLRRIDATRGDDERPRIGRAAVFAFAAVLVFGFADRATAAGKFATAVFHFNVQYVAGGLDGFLPLDLHEIFPGWELDHDEIEDEIILESFEPVLDLYLRHPGWGVDLEMQAYFLDVLAERHPIVLNKLRALAERGQASVVSFHYSDQLFIGYPAPAWEASADLTRETFEKHGIPLSTTVFCQEGQAGTGMAERMLEYGYETLVWPKNLWIYQHGEFDAHPYYDLDGIDVVVGAKGVNYNAGELRLEWTFLGDGELLATCDLDPYFPPIFNHYPKCVEEYETTLENLEADGWDIATVKEYVDAARDLGIQPETPPDLFDGTWQPSSTNGVWRWLGGAGLWRAHERDNHVRTLCEIAYRELRAAQTAAGAAGLDADDEIRELWRLLSLAMVTDGTGINPYQGEVGYAISRAAEVARRARRLIVRAKDALGYDPDDLVSINTVNETVMAEDLVPPDPPVEPAGPFDVEITSQQREATGEWRLIAFGDPKIWRFDVHAADNDGRSLRVIFPGDADEVIFTPALTDEEPVVYERSQFVYEDWPMALANGLINLSDGVFLVKDMALVHIAAFVKPDSGNVRFRDDTLTPNSAFTWRFYVIEGELDQALAFANALNVNPTLFR